LDTPYRRNRSLARPKGKGLKCETVFKHPICQHAGTEQNNTPNTSAQDLFDASSNPAMHLKRH
jgi:hypothetical protein